MKRRAVIIRNIILHILLLAAVFVGAVMFFSRTINQLTPDSTQSMADSTFPLVYMVRDGVNFNCLHGYAQEMDVTRLRDTITPLETDRSIGLCIQMFSTTIDSIAYEVIDLSDSSTLEHTQVIKTEEDNDYLTATLTLQNQMLMNREYALKIEVGFAGRTAYYYTHVLLADGLHTDDYLTFVNGFYDKTINRTDLTTVGSAVEPDETTDAEASLAYMDIHDSVQQLTWDELHPALYYKPTPQIKEINGNTASLVLDYRIAATADDGTAEIYNVREFYRVRYTDSRVFLLDFERTTDEIFNPEADVLDSTGIRLGITDKDVTYATDDNGRFTAFVQENELWIFERSSSKLTQVFSFPQKENMDARDFYDAHGIRILEVTTDGDVYFTVTGYMNRGRHEGENGILLYYYDSAVSMLDELLFLSSKEDHERLIRDVEACAYLTQDGTKFYVLMEEKLYCVSVSDGTYQVIAEQITEGSCVSGTSGWYAAWLQGGSAYDAVQIHKIDMESGEITTIEAPQQTRIRPLCYMNDDLVYGLAKEPDLERASVQTGLFPMYRLVIRDSEGNEIKSYEPDGVLVTQVEQSEMMLLLTRVVWNAGTGAFEETSSDEIVDTRSESTAEFGIATKESSRKQTEVYLRVGAQLTDLTPDLVYSKLISRDTVRSAVIPANAERAQVYSVYAYGTLQEVCTLPNEAVCAADDQVGVVVDTAMDYIWVRGNKDTSALIDLDKVPASMQTGTMDAEAIEEETGREVLDLTGCLLDEVLYYVSEGVPVLAQTAEGKVVTIVGYDEYNTCLLDAGGDEWYYYGINDSTAMFEEAGNVFMTVAP